MTKDARKVVIEGARRKEDEYTLDTTGFQFSRRPKHTRFQDDKEIKAEYYPECMEIIKQLTGAARVIPFHHCMLSTCPLTQSSTYPRYPGSYPSPESRWSQWCFGTSPAFINHPCRFHTTAFAISLLHKHFPNETPALLRNRLHITNLWRPISCPAIDWPLALCDCRSLDVDEDIKEATALVANNMRGCQSLYMKYNPMHRWVYKSAMGPEDFMLFKWLVSLSMFCFN